ncbi:MAG: ABC transporter permease [Gemmatimonadales bacterium]|jgi:cell division transport system permease protein|nr:ABC transporter permease [Gemmatimonadales bacterium]
MRLTIREALLSFRRAPLLSGLAVTTIGFALFVIGLFGLVALNLRETLTEVAERVEIVMYLARGTPVDVVTVAIGDIQVFPEVADVAYVTEDQALERARRELSEFQGVFSDLTQNPLPSSLEIRLKPGFRDAAHVAAVADRLSGFRFAEDIRFGGDWVEKLDRLRSIAAAVGLVVGIAFGAAAVIIIGTTIRMTVLARNREIQIMRLVGATDGFIRRPFLLDGAVKGALGGLLAIGLNYAAYQAVSSSLFRASFFSPAQTLLFLLIGTVLGFLASAASVNRHLPPL